MGHLPCLTASRASRSGYFLWQRARRTSIGEMFRMQGYDIRKHLELNNWPTYMSKSQIGHAIGNGNTTFILELILRQAFISLGWIENHFQTRGRT